MEQVLKWSSIASLCALLIVLAIQLKPRLVERADADPYANEETVVDSEQPLLHRIAAPDDEDAKAADEKGEDGGNEDASRHQDQRLPEARSINRHERRGRDRDRDDESPERGEIERFDVQHEDLRERHEALRDDEEPRFDVQREDLPERHEALIPDDDEPGEVERFDTKEADLPERHEALVEMEKNEDEAAVKYYLIPVPQDESTKE